MSIFETLNQLNVNGHTEEKNGLTYLSWAWAWAETKKKYPNATYEVKRFENNLPYVYDENTGYMVFVSVTIEDLTHEMWLPVMDGANKAMKSHPYEYTVRDNNYKWCKPDKDGKMVDKYGNVHTEFITKTIESATMFDINKTIMRALVKCLGMFGLGLYIYAGEDLPESIEQPEQSEKAETPKPNVDKPKQTPLQKEVNTLAKSVGALLGSTPADAYKSALLNLKIQGKTDEELTKVVAYFKNVIEKSKQG